jgi:hypothetical protein
LAATDLYRLLTGTTVAELTSTKKGKVKDTTNERVCGDSSGRCEAASGNQRSDFECISERDKGSRRNGDMAVFGSNGIARQEAKAMIGVCVVKDFFREDIVVEDRHQALFPFG